jgi:hypothetical protein
MTYREHVAFLPAKLTDAELREWNAWADDNLVNYWRGLRAPQVKKFLDHIAAQAEEIKALQDEATAIKGRLTEGWLGALLDARVSDEMDREDISDLAKAIISHVLGEQT